MKNSSFHYTDCVLPCTQGAISANNDNTIGELIATAFTKVGKEGVITVEEAKGMETYQSL